MRGIAGAREIWRWVEVALEAVRGRTKGMEGDRIWQERVGVRVAYEGLQLLRGVGRRIDRHHILKLRGSF